MTVHRYCKHGTNDDNEEICVQHDCPRTGEKLEASDKSGTTSIITQMGGSGEASSTRIQTTREKYQED